MHTTINVPCEEKKQAWLKAKKTNDPNVTKLKKELTNCQKLHSKARVKKLKKTFTVSFNRIAQLPIISEAAELHNQTIVAFIRWASIELAKDGHKVLDPQLVGDIRELLFSIHNSLQTIADDRSIPIDYRALLHLFERLEQKVLAFLNGKK